MMLAGFVFWGRARCMVRDFSLNRREKSFFSIAVVTKSNQGRDYFLIRILIHQSFRKPSLRPIYRSLSLERESTGYVSLHMQ